MLHCSTHISTQCIYTHIYLYVPLGNLKRVKAKRGRAGYRSVTHQDERRHDGHVLRLVSAQEEGGQRLNKGLTS